MLRVSDGLPGGLVDLWRLFWNQTCTCRGVTFRSVAIFFRVSTEGNLSFWNICSSIDSALEGMFQRVDFPLRLRPAPASPASSGAVSSSGRCRGDSGRPMGSPSAPSKLWAMRHRAARLAKCWPGSPLGRRLRRLRRASILIGHYIYPNEFAIGKQSNEAGGIFQLAETLNNQPTTARGRTGEEAQQASDSVAATRGPRRRAAAVGSTGVVVVVVVVVVVAGSGAPSCIGGALFPPKSRCFYPLAPSR